MNAPYFCNTTGEQWDIARGLDRTGHGLHGGFYGCTDGGIMCNCGQRFTVAELEGAPLAEAVSR